ncbi:hypothetical protein ACOMHN_054417 [Nucella lapillus]
MDTVRRW